MLVVVSPAKNLDFESEIPEDFQSLLDRLKTNENLT